MYISIIICTYNRAQLLKKCIESILDNKYNPDKYEIVIVDNNSNDNTKEIAEKFVESNSNINYVVESKVGLSYARNRGIEISKGDIIAFLDDDTSIHDGYLSSIKEFFDKYKDAVCVAGKIIPIWKEPKPKWFTNSFSSIVGETMYGEKDRKLIYPEMTIGANMVFYKKIFNEVGIFNVELGLKGDKLYLGEETDLCTRIRKKGYNVHYAANVIVDHAVHLSKVDKKYINKRLILEGETLAKIQLEEDKNKRILLGLKRGIILIARDLPLYLLCIINKNKKFEKKCKIDRSFAYIKTIFKY